MLKIRHLEATLFAALALAATGAQWGHLDRYPVTSVTEYASLFQIKDLVQHTLCLPFPERLTSLLTIAHGATMNGGESLTFNLFVWPFFAIMGFSTRALAVSSIAGHLLFAAALWWLVRRQMPGRSPLPFALVFFASPWYRAVIFSHTHNGLSVLLALVALALLIRALQRQTPASFAWAGLALGANLYGYAIGRTYPLLMPAFALVAILLGVGRSARPNRRYTGLFVLIATILLTLGVNLARPLDTAGRLLYDQEVVGGMVYEEELAARSEGPRQLGLRNLRQFFSGHGLRYHDAVLDLVLLFLFAVGAVQAVRRRDLAGLAFLYPAVFLVVGLAPFITEWTVTRMGPLCLPCLMVCAIGLDCVLKLAGRLPGRAIGRGIAVGLVLAAFAGGAIGANRRLLSRQADVDPVFQVAEDLARWPEPLTGVIATGKHPFDLQKLYAAYFSLIEAGRGEEVCPLRFHLYLEPSQMDRHLQMSPAGTALVVYPSENEIPRPTVPLRRWRSYPNGAAIYLADAAGEGDR